MKARVIKRPTTKRTISREQLARVLYRTMRIEQPSVTRFQAKRAAQRIKLHQM